MIFDGIEVLPDYSGYYRCPWSEKCRNPNYPVAKWKTLAGITKHLENCRARPEKELVYIPPQELPKERFGECPDCKNTIYMLESVWRIQNRIVCWDCLGQYHSSGSGHADSAGLEFPDITLEG